MKCVSNITITNKSYPTKSYYLTMDGDLQYIVTVTVMLVYDDDDTI